MSLNIANNIQFTKEQNSAVFPIIVLILKWSTKFGRNDPVIFWGHKLVQTDHKGHHNKWDHNVGLGDL